MVYARVVRALLTIGCPRALWSEPRGVKLHDYCGASTGIHDEARRGDFSDRVKTASYTRTPWHSPSLVDLSDFHQRNCQILGRR